VVEPILVDRALSGFCAVADGGHGLAFQFAVLQFCFGAFGLISRNDCWRWRSVVLVAGNRCAVLDPLHRIRPRVLAARGAITAACS